MHLAKSNDLPSVSDRLSPRSKILAIGILIILSFIVFANSLHNEFVYDDLEYVVHNEAIADLRNLPAFFLEPYPPHKPELSLYRPVVGVTYVIDYYLGGSAEALGAKAPHPFSFHLTNIVIHVIAAVVLYQLMIVLFGIRSVAFWCAVLFSVHPVHVEGVASVVGRAESLCGLFYLLSIYFYIRARPITTYRNRFYALSLVCFLVALLSKEMAATLPAMLVIVDYYMAGRENGKGERQTLCGVSKRHLWGYLPFAAVFVLYLFMRINAVNVLGIAEDHLYFKENTGLERLGSMLIVFVRYIGLMIVPVRFNADYNFPPPATIWAWQVIGSAVGLVGCIVGAAILTRRKTVVGFGLSWFLITLLPVSNIVPFGDLMAERFLYIPSIGFLLVIASVCTNAAQRRMSYARALVIFLIVYSALLSVQTVRRNTTWRNTFIFWEEMLRRNPDNAAAHYGFAAQLIEKGDTLGAIELYKEAIALKPDYHQAYMNLGNIYMDLKHYDEAIEAYSKGIDLYPLKDLYVFYHGIGRAYVAKQDFRPAIRYLKAALRFRPDFVSGRLDLGSCYASVGMYEQARKQWEQALLQEPYNGVALRNLKKLKALRKTP